MSEWKEYTLGELTTDGKGTYGIAASAVDYCAELPTYLRITDINDDGTIDFNGLKSVDDPNSSKYVLQENDIVFARTGASTGRSYFYDRRDGKFVYAGFLIKFSLDPKKVNPRILKYYTHSKVYYNWVHSFENGATRGNINAKTFADMKLLLPPRNVQDSIASILSSLDDKIAINRRICENLEAQAQALFKHWFIDFAPFKNGKFVESELGMIPEGWRVGTFGEIMTISSGKRPLQKGKYSDFNNIPLVGASEIMGYTNDYLFDEDIIVIGRVGTHGVVQRFHNACWPSDNTLVIKSNYYEFCYQLLKRIDYKSLNRGSTQPLISQSDIKNYPIIIPDENVLDIYENIASALMKMNNEQESSRLSALRDTLLPKLMSGEIKV